MSTRYLVAWAGDRNCGDALKLGAVLAQTFRAGLDVVYVVPVAVGVSGAVPGEKAFEDALLQEATAKMTRAVQQLGLPAEVDVRLHALRSPSVPAGILKAVEDLDASLLVVGAGHGGGLSASSMVVSSLLHASPVPVAMAPRGYRRRNHERLSEIVCAVGTRPGAQDVVDETVEAVLRAKVPLRLFSLVELNDRTDLRAGEHAREVTAQALERVRARVGEQVAVSMEVAEGRSMQEAVDRTSWPGDSIVVVGSSRLAPGRQTFLGSMAARLLSRLPVPMICVPSRGAQLE